jgi:hypothetical protein
MIRAEVTEHFFIMTAEINEALRDDNVYQWNCDDNVDH